jgi:AcrR family transcriptional regulator
MPGAVEKLTRKEAKERTRQRLVDAVLDHVRHYGLSGLTTGKVATAADIAQSSFYVHFTDMDDALRAAAQTAGTEIRAIIRGARLRMDFSNPDGAYATAFAGVIDALLAEREFTELLLSHRRDRNSPLGAALREVLDQSRADLASDLAAAGFQETVARDVDVYADLMVGMTLTAVEALLDGRIESREKCLRGLVRMMRAFATSALRGA